MLRLPIVGVMGSSQLAWEDYAVPLGRWLAKQPVHLLTGGGAGVMTSVSQAFVAVTPRQGLAIGCLPTEARDGQFVLRAGYPNPFIEIPIVTPLNINGKTAGVNRNFVNILTADIVIALPGNVGTLNEVELSLQFGKPLILYGPDDYFVDFPQAVTRYTDLPQVTAWTETQLQLLNA